MTRSGLLLRDYLPYKIGIVRGQINKVFEDTCLSHANVSISGWRVLALVAVKKNMSGPDVVERSGMRKMATSRAVANLVSSGLVKQTTSASDGRRSCLNVSPKGNKVYKSIIPAAKRFEQKIIEDLNSSELKTLGKLLDRVLASVNDLSQSGKVLYD